MFWVHILGACFGGACSIIRGRVSSCLLDGLLLHGYFLVRVTAVIYLSVLVYFGNTTSYIV